jgi:hypothetical protein
MWRDEMNHAFEFDRKLAQWRRRADRQRLEKIARKLHGCKFLATLVVTV